MQQKKCEFIKLNDIYLVEEVLFNFFLFFLEFERVFLLQREQPQILLWPGAIRVIHRYKVIQGMTINYSMLSFTLQFDNYLFIIQITRLIFKRTPLIQCNDHHWYTCLKKFQAIHRELCNIVHHTVLAASVQVYELSILSLRAKIRSRVVTMNNQTRISSWIRKRKTAPITLSLWWRRNGWSHAALWWINRGFQSMWTIKRK